MPRTTYADIMSAGQAKKEPILERALKLSYLIKQIENQGLIAQAKKVAISNAEADAYQDSVKFLIDVNKEKRAEVKFGMDKKTWEDNQKKIVTDAHNKERDEIQDNVKILEDLAPGSGLDYLATLPEDQKKYLPYASQRAESVKANASVIISDVNSILVDNSISSIEKKKRIKDIQTANPNISSGTKSNIAGAIGMVDNKIYEEVKTGWLVENPNHPDAGRVSLLPAGDAYKEILEKDALKDINTVFNRITKSTDTAFQLDMLEGAGLGVDLKGVKKAVGARLKQDIETINDASRKATENDGELYNKSFLEIKKRYPQYFDNATNSVKPQFKSIVQDSINSHYNRLRQQPQ